MAKSKAAAVADLNEFEKDLLESVKHAKRGEGRVTQGRREPSGAAKTLLRIALRSPEALRLAA